MSVSASYDGTPLAQQIKPADQMGVGAYTEPTWGRGPHGTKMRAFTDSCNNTGALHGVHLSFEAWQESRSRQENHSGRYAVQTVAYRLCVISPKGTWRNPDCRCPICSVAYRNSKLARFMQRAIQMQRLGGVSIVLLFQVP